MSPGNAYALVIAAHAAETGHLLLSRDAKACFHNDTTRPGIGAS